ncbi:MAG: hypothetical protein HY926_13565 [Elusimicrobia bacterium]|nr:hypothetical protein [Elusimicrobiota bacterium]
MLRIVALLFLLAGPAAAAGPEPGVFVFGGARFTVVAPECVRIEYSTAGVFRDAPSAFARRRDARYLGYSVELSTGRLVLDTGRLRLSYVPDGWPLSIANLKAEIRRGTETVAWVPERDPEPLLEGGSGVLTRMGWSLVDDSAGRGADWYLFAYGLDYKAGLRALAALKGPPPSPRDRPRGQGGRLEPYLLSAARQARDQGLPLRRPLYVEYPQQEEAYRHPREVFIGDSLLEVPAGQEPWLPEGPWFELSPASRLWVKGGVPIPMRAPGQAPQALVLRAYPGPEGVTGRTALYEKDGVIELSCLRQGDRTRVMAEPAAGSKARRAWVVELGGPRAVRAALDGKDLAAAYDAKARLSRVRVPARDGGWTLYLWQP